MEVSDVLLGEDLDRAFADWGREVVWREVSTTYEPETQQVSESHSDVSVTAIVGAATSRAAAGTGGQHLVEEREFLVRASEFPGGAPGATDRVVHGGEEYDVVEFARVAAGLAFSVRGRKR